MSRLINALCCGALNPRWLVGRSHLRMIPVVVALALVALPGQKAFADCSAGKRFACGLLEAGCFPGALGGREAFLQCVAKISNNECNACISGEPGSPICWDGSSSQQAGNCGGVSGQEYGLSIPKGFSGTSVGPNQDGHLELILPTRSGLTHLWQQAPSGQWTSDAVAFPGSPATAFPPALIRHVDGRLEVFVVARDQSVRRIGQLAPNVNWGGWGTIRGVAAMSSVSTVIDESGRTSLAVLGVDSRVWLASLSSSGLLTPWRSLSGVVGGPPTIAINADGRLEVFAVGTDGALRHAWELAPNQSWSDWASFGGSFVGAPAFGRNADGRLEVFASTPNGVLRHVWQVAPNSGWSAWADFPGTHKYSVSVFQNVNGSLTVYAVGVLDSAVWYTTQDFSTASWGDWKSLGGVVVSAPRIAMNADGTLEVFGVGQDHSVWHTKQRSVNGVDWSGWQRVGGANLTPIF